MNNVPQSCQTPYHIGINLRSRLGCGVAFKCNGPCTAKSSFGPPKFSHTDGIDDPRVKRSINRFSLSLLVRRFPDANGSFPVGDNKSDTHLRSQRPRLVVLDSLSSPPSRSFSLCRCPVPLSVAVITAVVPAVFETHPPLLVNPVIGLLDAESTPVLFLDAEFQQSVPALAIVSRSFRSYLDLSDKHPSTPDKRTK